MVGEPHQEEHYGKKVWVSPVVETLRRSECLCYNCKKLEPGQDETNCPIAGALYNICKMEDVALTVTRCPVFERRESPPKFS